LTAVTIVGRFFVHIGPSFPSKRAQGMSTSRFYAWICGQKLKHIFKLKGGFYAVDGGKRMKRRSVHKLPWSQRKIGANALKGLLAQIGLGEAVSTWMHTSSLVTICRSYGW
jgi:hypothetical protein